MFLSFNSLFVSATEPELLLDARLMVVNLAHVKAIYNEMSEELGGEFSCIEMTDGDKHSCRISVLDLRAAIKNLTSV